MEFPGKNVKGILSVVVGVMGLLASGALGFPPGTPEATQHVIIGWVVWALALYSAVNGILHFMPDAPPAPPATGAPR